MIYLRQSTASQEVPLGYFLDSTDGNTEETALTVANTDIKLWKTGATTLANKNSGGATHISNGIYYAVLDATDTDTIGPLVIFCHMTGALAIRLECCVLAANVYDVMFGTTALATVSNITGGTITTATNVTTVNGLASGVITAASIATDAIDADALASDVVTDIWQGTALTEAYASDGAAATPAQLLYMIWSLLAERSISTTTLTAKKLDGTTTAMTFTLDSATAPTSQTRAT